MVFNPFRGVCFASESESLAIKINLNHQITSFLPFNPY
jgi:hypothetical protein